MGVYCAETRVLTDLATINSNLNIALSQTQVKSGAWAYRTTTDEAFGHAEGAGIAAIRMGYWLHMASSGIAADNSVLYFAGNGLIGANTTNSIWIEINPSLGTITVERPLSGGSTTETLYTHSGIPTELSTTGAWFSVGIRHTIHASTGFISLYIGGALVFTYIGDTRPSNVDSGQQFQTSAQYFLCAGRRAGAGGFTDAYIDDLYVDEAVGEADDFVPGRGFHVIFPTGTGENADFTPTAGANWENVDDNPNDGSTTENQSTTDQDMDTFAFADTFTLPAQHTIVQVIATPFARQLDSGAQLSVHAFDGTLYDHSDPLDLPTGYSRPVFAVFPLQPDGSPWTENAIDNCEFGYRAEIS